MSRTSISLFVDLELSMVPGTTGIREIVELGAVAVDHYKSEIVREDSWLVRPSSLDLITPELTALTGIHRDEVKTKGRPFHEVVASFKKKFGQDKPIYTWGNDAKFIKASISVRNKGLEPSYDINRYGYMDGQFVSNFVNISPIISAMAFADMKRRIGLDEAMEFLGLDFSGNRHRALDDARATAKVFMKVSEIVKSVSLSKNPAIKNR